jgi:hypothetical protein
MKSFLFIVATLFVVSSSFSQDYTVNHESPTSVVNAIFYAAKTGNYSVLGTLCDPVGSGDGDVKNLCQLGYGFSEADKQAFKEKGVTEEQFKEEFRKVFGKGQITGTTRFKSNEFGNYAEIDFYFYPDGTQKRMETMNLVQRGNNWYISSF